jgi:Leucine-rich repeat (LRR) protein
MLEGLYLNETNVAILTDLSEMPFLGVLSLQNTQVSSIEPLSGLQRLFSLNLTGSKVGDLRPALTFKSLKNPNSIEQILYSGLSFRDTPAAASSPELTVLSQIEDDYESTERTLAYLRTLPPYPEPLPWDAPPEPATDNLPRILLNDNQVDVANVPLIPPILRTRSRRGFTRGSKLLLVTCCVSATAIPKSTRQPTH